MQITNAVDAEPADEPLEAGPGDVEPEVPDEPRKFDRESVLQRIKGEAVKARENYTIDIALPETVPGDLGLRLGVPRVAHGSYWDADEINTAHDVRDLASNIVGVVALRDDGDGWDLIDGLAVEDAAATFGAAVRGDAPVIASPTDAVRELFSCGSPLQVQAQPLNVQARLYRRWSLDPTRALF